MDNPLLRPPPHPQLGCWAAMRALFYFCCTTITGRGVNLSHSSHLCRLKKRECQGMVVNSCVSSKSACSWLVHLCEASWTPGFAYKLQHHYSGLLLSADTKPNAHPCRYVHTNMYIFICYIYGLRRWMSQAPCSTSSRHISASRTLNPSGLQ